VALQESNLPAYAVSPGEVSHAYGIFHLCFKKGQKATGEVFIVRLQQLLAGRI
jgi:hypothetical protein